MSSIVDLFKSKWLTVREKTMDNGGKYLYTHAEWCNSQGVAVLPFRFTGELQRMEFLGRFEVCPAHSDKVELCSITGGMDKEDELPIHTALRELEEEGGYQIPVVKMWNLGQVRPSKASDNTMHLFGALIDDSAIKVEAIGDGTLGEEGSFCEWIDSYDVLHAKDPLLHTMYLRLQDNLFKKY